MADIVRVKISELDEINFDDVNNEDQFVINDVSGTDFNDIATFRISFGAIIDYITKQDLNFKGNNTYLNTIQPPVGEQLDAIFDDVLVRRRFTLAPSAVVEGFNINTDADDVDVDRTTLTSNDVLIWDEEAVNGDGAWVNIPSTEVGFEDAPADGRIYARQNNSWIDITDCIECAEVVIGFVSINRKTVAIEVTEPVTFEAINGGTAKDVMYQWSVSPAAAMVGPTNKEVTILFPDEDVVYTVSVELTSNTATDSPQSASTTIVFATETFRIETEAGEDIQAENDEHLEYDY